VLPDNNFDPTPVHGVIYLPTEVLPSGPELFYECLQSRTTAAHGTRMVFSPNVGGLDNIQLVVPAIKADNNDVAGMMFVEALVEAERVQRCYSCWMRDLLVVQKISLIEIISTCSAASYGCGIF